MHTDSYCVNANCFLSSLVMGIERNEAHLPDQKLYNPYGGCVTLLH